MGRLVSVNANQAKEFRKYPQAAGRLIPDFGLEGDRHAGRPRRQVSLLNAETIEELAATGMTVSPGVFGENLTIEGVPVMELPTGARLRVGEAVLEITGERPACRDMLAIHRDALKAMIGRAGRMARVVAGGTIRAGDPIEVVLHPPSPAPGR